VSALLAALSAQATSAGPSLSDAARRAEEQRRANGEPTVVLTPPAPAEDEGHPRLTEDLVVRYARARLALADLRRRDLRVQQRLIDLTREIHHYEAFIDVLDAVPDTVTLLDSFRLTPRLYVSTDVTLRQMQDRRRTPKVYREPNERDLENLAFVSAHQSLVDGVMRQCDAHERGLRLWWGAGPGWW
jgi:hypothetical protein